MSLLRHGPDKKKKNFIPRSISAKTFTGKGYYKFSWAESVIELRRNDKFSQNSL